MVQASIGNSRDFQKVADALVLQHPRIHVREHRRHGGRGSKGTSKGYRKDKFMTRAWKGGRRPGKGASSSSSKGTAYIADGDEDWHEDVEDNSDEPANDAAYVACSSDEDDQEGVEQEEQDEELFADTLEEAA